MQGKPCLYQQGKPCVYQQGKPRLYQQGPFLVLQSACALWCYSYAVMMLVMLLLQVSQMHVHIFAPHQQQALQQVSHMRVGMLTLPEQQAMLLHKSFLCTSSVRSLQAIFRTCTESSPCHFCCYLFQRNLNLMELLCCSQAASMQELSTIPCFWSRPYLP